MPRPLRLAFLKPDHGVAGGLEAVVAHLERIARADGHEVTRVSVDMRPERAEVAGIDVPREVWDSATEFFPYVAGWDRFERLDVRRYDAVISTQPPSFAVRHPRHLSVFYHHHRLCYDLEEAYLEAGYADPAIHREAAKLVRELDQPALDEVGWFLAGSDTVAARLERFNGRRNVSVLHAGLIVGSDAGADAGPRAPAPPGTGAVLTIGRLEFPKRTELVVAAAHLLPAVRFAVVGTGGRDRWIRHLDRAFADGTIEPATVNPRALWCTTGRDVPDGDDDRPADPADPATNVEVCGRLGDDELARRLAEAPCVVAPALDEDYGLTAIEAMAAGRPVIVCTDGGGLTELVDHEVTGLVVDPTPAAIAAAVDRLVHDRDLAAELGRNGLARAAELTWDRAAHEWRAGLDRVLS